MNWYQSLGSIIIVGSLLSACGLNVSLDNDQPEQTPTTIVATDPEVDVQATVEALVRATTRAEAEMEADVEQTTPPPFEPAPASPTAAPETNNPPDDTTPGTAPSPQQETESEPTTGQTVVFAPEDEAAQQTVNIQLVFDASGSMAEDIGGETKIAAARRAIERVIDQLETDNPNLNVGFRVFGHEGDNTEAGKALSCQSTELLVPMDGVNTTLLQEQTNAWEPTGWTPISLALQRAGEDMQAGENVRNVIIMVTDGEETCEGDPCAVAQALADSDADVRIDVVGFGTTPEQNDKLRCISENSGGTFIEADDPTTLAEIVPALVEGAASYGTLYIRAIGPGGEPVTHARIQDLLDEQGQKPVNVAGDTVLARNRDGSPEPPAGPFRENGETTYELTPGTYTFRLRYDPNLVADHFDVPDSYTTYTAIIAAGQVTEVSLGIGSATLLPENVDNDYRCYLEIDTLVEGEWIKLEGFATTPPCDTRFSLNFDEQYLFYPGQYRVMDYARSDDGSAIAEFTIEPGKEVVVRVAGSG